MAKIYSIKAQPWMEKMLKELNESFGYSKVEAFRYGLRLLHRRELPHYKNTLTDMKENDPEDYCKSIGGEYKIIDGKKACILTEGSGERIKYL